MTVADGLRPLRLALLFAAIDLPPSERPEPPCQPCDLCGQNRIIFPAQALHLCAACLRLGVRPLR